MLVGRNAAAPPIEAADDLLAGGADDQGILLCVDPGQSLVDLADLAQEGPRLRVEIANALSGQPLQLGGGDRLSRQKLQKAHADLYVFLRERVSPAGRQHRPRLRPQRACQQNQRERYCRPDR